MIRRYLIDNFLYRGSTRESFLKFLLYDKRRVTVWAGVGINVHYEKDA